MLETVAISGQMLDARYLMPDIQKCTWNEIQKPVSLRGVGSTSRRPGSIHNANGFRLNSLSPMQLSGLPQQGQETRMVAPRPGAV